MSFMSFLVGAALQVGIAGIAVREVADVRASAGGLGHGLLGRQQASDDVQAGQGLLVQGQLLHLLDLLLHSVPPLVSKTRQILVPRRIFSRAQRVPSRQAWRSSALAVAAPRVVLSKMHQTVRPASASARIREARAAISSPE